MLADALRDAAPPFLASDSGKEAGTGQRKQLGYFDRFRKKKCLQYATHMHEAKKSINLILSRSMLWSFKRGFGEDTQSSDSDM